MLTQLLIDDGPHSMDGLRLLGSDEAVKVEAFISRRVIDAWIAQSDRKLRRPSLYRAQYTALGKANLAAINRIVVSKYNRGLAFNRQHPFVDVLLADIVNGNETLDVSTLR
jgi:hypothetical protein